jgi:ferredoxin
LYSVTKLAVVDPERCSACSTCIRLCPVEAITLDKTPKRPVAQVDGQKCLACTICMTRCPEYAVIMAEREEPLYFGVDAERVSQDEIALLCRAAHMFPDQIICYCRRIPAKEVAAAILLGAKTPEDISRATGIRTGCGVLCITTVFRLMKAASLEPGEAPGDQWYGTYLSIWDVPEETLNKYPEYFLADDLKAMNHVFPGGDRK